METVGTHLLVELHGCDRAVLDDKGRVETLLRSAARRAGATEVGVLFHTFAPQGVSGVVVVEESHLSIHTWPEHGYAAIDFFTCGECTPNAAIPVLSEGLSATRTEVLEVRRGLPLRGPSDRATGVAEHRVLEAAPVPNAVSGVSG